MSSPPTHLRALKNEGVFELRWTDDCNHRLPFRFLRGRCPCAACVDEVTGLRVVDVDDVPLDVQPAGMSVSGNYALKISWTDGHDTGLYTWKYLAELAREAQFLTGGTPREV